jgi:hypothetical protein
VTGAVLDNNRIDPSRNEVCGGREHNTGPTRLPSTRGLVRRDGRPMRSPPADRISRLRSLAAVVVLALGAAGCAADADAVASGGTFFVSPGRQT